MLIFLGPAFIALEGLSSLLVFQNLGQEGRRLIRDSEREYYQFALLIATAVAYVISAWWIVVVSELLCIQLGHVIANDGHRAVLSLSCIITIIVDFTGRSLDVFRFSDFHWLCAAADKHY